MSYNYQYQQPEQTVSLLPSSSLPSFVQNKKKRLTMENSINMGRYMDPTPQLRLEEAINSALTRGTTQFLTDRQGTRAADNLTERLSNRACKIRNTLLYMEDNKHQIQTTPRIMPELLQQRRELTHIRDWQQRKQRWHRLLLRWRRDILAGTPSITPTDFQQARRRHMEAHNLHHHYIHRKQLPKITPTELAILAAYDPLLELWRTTLPTQRPTLPLNFTNPPTIQPIPQVTTQ
jgi:hypothetical protein